MMRPAPRWAVDDDATRIARALTTEGGHLLVGHGGYTLYHDRGATLRGYDVPRMKALCVAAGLPVIDVRGIPIDTLIGVVVRCPMVAVGKPIDPPPWDAFAYAPLAHVTRLYQAAGAEVINVAASDPPGVPAYPATKEA